MSDIFTTTPPTEPGWYWVRICTKCRARPMERLKHNWLYDDTPNGRCATTEELIGLGYQFGPRIPSPLVCAELNWSPDRALPDASSDGLTGPRSYMFGIDCSVADLVAFFEREHQKLQAETDAYHAQQKGRYTLADVHGVYFSNEHRSWIDANGRSRPIEELEESACESISWMMGRILSRNSVGLTGEQTNHPMCDSAALARDWEKASRALETLLKQLSDAAEPGENGPESSAKNVAVSPR